MHDFDEMPRSDRVALMALTAAAAFLAMAGGLGTLALLLAATGAGV